MLSPPALTDALLLTPPPTNHHVVATRRFPAQFNNNNNSSSSSISNNISADARETTTGWTAAAAAPPSPGGVEASAGGTQENISYSAERIIGNGSFGVVFEAKVVETNEVVAIKKVLQDKRFKNRELQIMRQLVKDPHTNIVALKHCFYSQVRGNYKLILGSGQAHHSNLSLFISFAFFLLGRETR